MSGDGPAEDEGRTVFVPGAGSAPPSPPLPQGADLAAMRTEAPVVPLHPARPGGRLQPGDRLNGVYEVRRYITAGGMGEVWEGASIQDDERVAIKVMLPHLAADPRIQAMFRKEAKTLTRIRHDAIVPYRLLAMDEALGILYIATAFVDGPTLEKRLGDVPRDAAALTRFTRRLAEGLRAAHKLGAVHRDMSPDNVLLEGGDLDRAQIIDFGIAKDLDAQNKTIIGDGFAGKFAYVAPEQLGDFGRQIGEWSDVYSLALVVLAVAGGRAPDTGATMVEAVDRRRAGIDLSPAPAELRPVLARMLEADPERRLRSMDAVIAALDGSAGGTPPRPPAPAKTRRAPEPPGKEDWRRPAPAALLGGAAAALLAIGAGGWWLLSGDGRPTPAPAASGAATVAPPSSDAAGDPVASAQAALARIVPGVPCSWLDVSQLRRDGAGVSLALGGVAGEPVAAQAALSRALSAAGVTVRDMQADVLTLPSSACGAVETFSQVRAAGPAMLSVPKAKWEMDVRPDSSVAGKVARVLLHLDPRVNADNFALAFVNPGEVQAAADGDRPAALMEREKLLSLAFEPGANGVYTMKNADTDEASLKGVALIRGRAPFPTTTVGTPLPPTPGWRDQFLRTARAQGWTVEMVWFQTQDVTPN